MIPQTNIKILLLNYFMSPETRKIELELQKQEYQHQIEMEKTSSNFEIFTQMLFQTQKFSPFFSLSNFLDFLCFYITLALGLFTLSLICQTTYYVYRQSSLIDQTKRLRHNKEIR